jgi:hypothetical protein
VSLRKRLLFAGGVAALALLALPSLVGANPGTGPELVQRSGRLVVVHADRDDGSSTQQWMLVDGTDALPVRAPAEWIEPGSRVRLQGTMQAGALVLADSLSAVQQTGLSSLQAAADDPAPAPGAHNVAVILAEFAAGPGWTQPANPSVLAAQGIMFNSPATVPSVAQYYQETTYGQIALHGTVFGPVELPGAPGTSCSGQSNATGRYTWMAQAEQVAHITDSDFQHVVLALPAGVTACGLGGGVAGIAEVGGKYVWDNGDFSVRVLAHEIGHNLGLAHAGGLACSNAGVAAPMGDACQAAGFEYQDPFDAMGSGDSGAPTAAVRQMSMEHKLALHLLPASAVKVVGASGSYHLAPMETLSGTAELLRIPKAGGGNYFVEYRQPLGYFDANPTGIAGVLIRTESPEIASSAGDPNADTALIDMHPGTQPDWDDAAMDVGQVFSDPLSAITIKDLGQDAAGATLQVTMPLDSVPPGLPSDLSAVARGTSAVLSWSAAVDDLSVAGYVVTRDGTQIATVDATDFTDSGLTPGKKVRYTVAAVDAAGNVGPAASVGLAIPDGAPPGAPPKVTARVTKDGKVLVSWSAARDNGRVAGYRVRRAGRLIGTTSARTYMDKAPKPGRGATVAYSVVAFDLSGNVGAAGKARPVRAALLRKLTVSNLRVAGLALGVHTQVLVEGTISDAQAVCRVRIGTGAWQSCRTKPNGAFSVSLRTQGSQPLEVSLRDALGRVRLQTLAT